METTHAVLRGAASTSELLLELVAANRAGRPLGLPSVCSAERFVLEAALRRAARHRTVVLVESTCNQVNQLGGYTGLRPADFAALAAEVAGEAGYPLAGLILGGDHLGPYPWRHDPAAAAMAKACDLVRACVLAGYTKVHLDCSMRLADDPGVPGDGLSDETAAARTARLVEAAEEARRELLADRPAPLYVIGTEVPTPGGEVGDGSGPSVTTAAQVERTWSLCAAAFAGNDRLRMALDRVVALVVQPGVEFGPDVVHDYHRTAGTRELSGAVERLPHLVYEAHSTDYQTREALRELVEDHFAVLKVGPALTFAAREALFALAAIEDELRGGRTGGDRRDGPASRLRETLERVMTAHPEHWRDYYAGDAAARRLARSFAYSDRIRYYWAHPEVAAAVDRLMGALGERPIPPTLLGQYLPDQACAVRRGELPARPSPRELVRHKVLTVLDDYAAACGTD